MSNIHNIDISLKDIVKNIDKGNYLIPKFQRDFVWYPKDISELGDSIIRGYPISSLLLMPTNGTLQVGHHRLFEDDFNQKENSEVDQKHYILDGQQRITSIGKLFLSKDSQREYYFDLLAILLEKYPKDGILDLAGIKEKVERSGIRPIDTDHESDICRSFGISKNGGEQPTRHYHRYISGKSIINNEFGAVIYEFCEDFKTNRESHRKYINYLNAVLGIIGEYKIPATVIASDSELGVVIRVFEKVNSTGKKLTLFDLINAQSFQKQDIYKDGLADYLVEDIKNKLERIESLKTGVNKFLEHKEDFFNNLARITRIFEITHLLGVGAIPSIFKAQMLNRGADFWFKSWNEKGNKLLDIISWMENEKLIDVVPITFLEYASAILLASPKSFESSKFKHEIKKYGLYLTLTGKGFSKSNLDDVTKLYALSTDIDNGSNHLSVNLTKKEILEFTTSKTSFSAVLNILYIEKINTNFMVDIEGYDIDIEKSEYYYIYPKLKDKKSKFNSIANVILINGSISRNGAIKDKSTKEYFSLLNQKTDGKFFCEQNLIDIDEAMKIETEIDAEIFIENRAVKIAEIVNSYFQE